MMVGDTFISFHHFISFHPIQEGDVPNTFADNSSLKNWINYSPTISIEVGLRKFAIWYKNYYYSSK